MLPIALRLKPGIDTQSSTLQSEGGLTAGNLIRYKNGLIQKQGGCVKMTNDLIVNVARCLFPWADLRGNAYMAIGTDVRLQLFVSGNIIDITPIEDTNNLTNAFSTVINTPIVTIVDAGYAPAVGSWINIINAIYIGGLVLQGLYEVLTVGGGNSYTINAGSNATSTVNNSGTAVHFATTMTSATVAVTLGSHAFVSGETLTIGVSTIVGGITFLGNYAVTASAGPIYTINGGNVASGSASGFENSGNARISYLTPLPPETQTAGAFGTGPFGAGAFGVGAASGNPYINTWTMDKFGQNLVAAWRTGPIYEWVPPVAAENVATEVVGAPQAVNGIFTAAPAQQLVAYGIYSVSLAEQDALLVGWCDVDDINTWTASSTNQAGTFRLSSGSKIVGGMWIGTVGLLWTDLDLWSQTYSGFPLIYAFNQISRNCGLVAPRAMAVVGSTIEWLSQNDFFKYQGGSVTLVPCTVRDFIFNNIDYNYADAIFAAPNAYFGEITWWFPTIGSLGVCNAYVRHNINEDLWDCGPLPEPPSGYVPLEISAWTDQSVLGAPIGAFFDSRLEQFETSNDIDGAVYDSWLTTGWFQLAEGEEFIFLERIIPDFVLTGTNPTILVTVYVSDYPTGAAVTTYGPFTVNATTQFLPIRARGRVCQLRVDCVAPNTFWRYGKPLAVVSVDGRR